MKTNQGKIASFEEAMKMAYEDMHEDTKAIRERRKMRRMKIMEQKPGVSGVAHRFRYVCNLI